MGQFDRIERRFRGRGRGRFRLRGCGIRRAPQTPFAVGDGIQRGDRPQRMAIGILDADGLTGVRIHHQPEGLSRKFVGNLEELAFIGDRAVLAGLALNPVMEDGVEAGGLGAQRPDLRQILLIAFQRGLAIETRVGTPVVDLGQPGP